jgi:hypothetical protein
MTILPLPSGLSIRTLISSSSTWIERTCARAMPSTLADLCQRSRERWR